MPNRRSHSIPADNLFDRKGHGDDACYRCGKEFRDVNPSAKSLRRFKQMTGRAFPGSFVSLNVEADAKSLGVESRGRGSFCGDCAVAYMTEFNRLLQEAKMN